MSVQTKRNGINVNTLRKMKQSGEKVTCMTAYDYTSAKILDAAGIDTILVGDSLGMVMNGYETTLPVTLDEMIYHTKAVKRGISGAFLIIDMPFGSYGAAIADSVANCMRAIKETGANAVKLEGGVELAPLVKNLVLSGVNVMGHIGLRPQSINTMGGYKIFGKNGAEQLIADAKALDDAEAFAIVLEGMTAESAKYVTEAVSSITIGIGAGVACDGQVLVFHDAFGLFTDFTPKFVKRYADAGSLIGNATKEYIADVKAGRFPDTEHSF